MKYAGGGLRHDEPVNDACENSNHKNFIRRAWNTVGVCIFINLKFKLNFFGSEKALYNIGIGKPIHV